jgi:hypothetical protein
VHLAMTRPQKRRTPLEAIAKFCRKCAGGRWSHRNCWGPECCLYRDRLTRDPFPNVPPLRIKASRASSLPPASIGQFGNESTPITTKPRAHAASGETRSNPT